MVQPATRILAVLELLQTHGRLSGSEMAARLSLDRRTLRRYIVALEEIGIPIMTERGRHGGYALMPGFKLPPMMFNEEEALALGLGLQVTRQLGSSANAASVVSAQAKLERVMPDKLKLQMRAIHQSVTIDLNAANGQTALATQEAGANILIFSTACFRNQRLHVIYRALNGASSERDLDPYGVVFYLGYWYVVGWCYLRQSIRTFRLDRVLSVATLEQYFAPPVSFNAFQHLRKAIASLPRRFSAQILLRTDMSTARAYLLEPLGVLEQTERGVMFYNQADDLAWLARQLASLPFRFEIEHPEQLRHEVKKLAQRLLDDVGELS